VVDVDALESGTGRCELEDVGQISVDTAAMLACDASITRIVTKGRAEPLDVGRATPLISAALRKALVERDGGCRFPGCDRPPSWCDGHHVVHWSDGGRTCLGNMLLLCRRHHGLIHRGAFSVRMIDGRPTFFRADGSVLEDRAPP
jgi:hypothetical protein